MVKAKAISVAVMGVLVFSASVILMELEVVQLGIIGGSHDNVEGLLEPDALEQSYISFNPATKVRLPNQGRSRGECRSGAGMCASASKRTCFSSSDMYLLSVHVRCANGGFSVQNGIHVRHI